MSFDYNSYISGLALKSVGFQPAKQTRIPAIMNAITPVNGTAMRDSLIVGCQLMLRLYQILAQRGMVDEYNFVHVILTDGYDCNSKNSLEDALKVMLLIGKIIPVKCLKIILIGVGVQAQAEQELQALAYVAGQNAQYYNVSSSQIGSLFNKIQVNLGIQQNNAYLQVVEKHFAVMFNLDVSGSMIGEKWGAVCASVNHFISKMGNTDVVSGLVFNDKVRLICDLQMGDELIPRQRTFSAPKPKQPAQMTRSPSLERIPYNGYSYTYRNPQPQQQNNGYNYNYTYQQPQPQNNGCQMQ